MHKLYNGRKRKAISEFSVNVGKFTVGVRIFAVRIGKFAYGKDIYIMYRDKLEEIRKEKGLSYKKWSEESGVSIDTIQRITHAEHPDKDSPKVNTLEDLCKPLGIELWEIFYLGDRSFVSLQAEISTLKAERDALVAENAVLKDKVESLKDKVDTLKDDLIAALKQKSNN